MEESYILLGTIGVLLIITNKYLSKALVWWERNIIKFKDSLNLWFYRITIIVVGFIFIGIAAVKYWS